MYQHCSPKPRVGMAFFIIHSVDKLVWVWGLTPPLSSDVVLSQHMVWVWGLAPPLHILCSLFWRHVWSLTLPFVLSCFVLFSVCDKDMGHIPISILPYPSLSLSLPIPPYRVWSHMLLPFVPPQSPPSPSGPSSLEVLRKGMGGV